MATSSGCFSIASSPPGAISGVSSPVKSGRSGVVKKVSSAAQLLEQIRQLEAEGNKLRTETSILGCSSVLNTLTDFNSSNSNDRNELPKFVSTSPNSLSALVDISSEQKTISDLRLQLEQQRKETERLNAHLMLDGFTTSTSRAGTVLHIPSSPSKTGFSTLPSTDLFSSRRPASVTGATGVMEFSPPSHLEKALKDSQEQVADLRRRLVEASELSESQKRQFRLNVEELKAKLHDTMINRDSLLDLRQKEITSLENKMSEQSSTIRELQYKLKAQEQTITETSRKADGYSRENFVSETTLNQVRLILVDAERRRGRPYFESDPASHQNPSMLVHTLERCIQELLKDLDIKKSKVDELEKEMGELKHNLTSDQQNVSQEYQQKITQMSLEHERVMQAANEKASNARKQAASLESQLSAIQCQYEQQMKVKEETLKDFENKISHLREELNEERDKYSSKRESLEHTLHDTEKEMSKLRTERDDAVKSLSGMESRVVDLQLTINKLTRDLEAEKENSSKFWEREGQLRSRTSQLETRLEEKTRDVDRLEKMLASVKQECNVTVTEKVSMIERQERDRHMEKMSSLTAQLSEVSEKCNKLSIDLENTKVENRDLRQQNREMTDRTDTTKVQYEAAVAERKHLTDMLTAKSSDLDRVSQERDYYFSIMEQKNNDISQLKTNKERLTLQLEEMEKNVGILQEQVNGLQKLLDSSSYNCDTLKEERNILVTQLQDTTSALEELKTSRDSMAKKMKIREKRVKELESEKQKTSEEIELRKQEMGIIQQEKETMFKDLKESRYEVASLAEERDSLRKDLESQKYQLDKTISKLQYRLKNTEQDLALTQRALKKRESVDNTAVKMADKMQKEVTAKRSLVDILQTKIRWYQDQIDALMKEKSNIENDKEKLKTCLNKALVQNQQLSVELETTNSRSVELKGHAQQLESSLEKAVLRNATTHAQVEMFEQEITRMKLAHQLEIKEAVQKAVSQSKEKQESQSCNIQGTSLPHPEVSYAPRSQRNSRFNPEHMAQEDRLIAQKSSENYKEIGSELKLLLNEMRDLISDRQDNVRSIKSSQIRDREMNCQKRESRARPKLKPKTLAGLPEYKKKAFVHYRLNSVTSDAGCYSDAEVDDRIHNKSRSLMAAYHLYSPKEKDCHRRSSRSKHRRSRSSEASFSSPLGSTQWMDSDYKSSDLNPFTPDSDVTDTNHYTENTNESGDPLPTTQTTFDSEISSLSIGSPIMESTKEDNLISQIPDTHGLCKRLEERIIGLTRLGDNLQKENKEMADLMSTQGQKLQRVKENEKKLHKTSR